MPLQSQVSGPQHFLTSKVPGPCGPVSLSDLAALSRRHTLRTKVSDLGVNKHLRSHVPGPQSIWSSEVSGPQCFAPGSRPQGQVPSPTRSPTPSRSASPSPSPCPQGRSPGQQQGRRPRCAQQDLHQGPRQHHGLQQRLDPRDTRLGHRRGPAPRGTHHEARQGFLSRGIAVFIYEANGPRAGPPPEAATASFTRSASRAPGQQSTVRALLKLKAPPA
jgi:hypothetical protein